MIAAASRGGLIGILLIIGLLYFSGAGTWMWTRVNNLPDNCYAAATRMSSSMANTVCGAVAHGVEALNNSGSALSDRIQNFKERLGISSSLDSLNALSDRVSDNVAALASSRSDLSELISKGPNFRAGGSVKEQFQQAIDSFAIGQLYMKDSNTAPQAVPWLQRGAEQPEGFGVMSQLALGNIYAQGGQGVPQNPQVAQAYLEQAKQSLSILTGSRTIQSQQMLQALPAAPADMQQQINQMIAQLKLRR